MADTLELIKALPPELREKILKEYIKIKLWQRKMLGWDSVREEIQKGYIKMKLKQREAIGWAEVHDAIDEAPYCYLNEQIVNVLSCYCGRYSCPRDNLCNLCYRNGGNHYLVYPIHIEDNYNDCFNKSYDDCFKKDFDVGWSGVVAWYFWEEEQKPIFILHRPYIEWILCIF